MDGVFLWVESGVFLERGRKPRRRLSLWHIALHRDRTLGTQVSGVRSPDEQGTVDIQGVC